MEEGGDLITWFAAEGRGWELPPPPRPSLEPFQRRESQNEALRP